MIDELVSGYRLQKPPHCPGRVYELLLECWAADPLARPAWPDISGRLQTMVDVRYLDKYWKIETRQRKVYQDMRELGARQKNRPCTI